MTDAIGRQLAHGQFDIGDHIVRDGGRPAQRVAYELAGECHRAEFRRERAALSRFPSTVPVGMGSLAHRAAPVVLAWSGRQVWVVVPAST